MSLKVSDEFTVPLCAIHHHNIHTTGKEREWWQERKIDPIIVANHLWQRSRERYPAALEVDPPKSLEADRRLEGDQPNDNSTLALPATATDGTSDEAS